MLEHITHLHIDVGHAVIVALVERYRPIDGEHEIVVHHQLQTETAGEVRTIDVFGIVKDNVVVEVVKVKFGIVFYDIVHNHLLVKTVGLQNQAHIHERVQTDEEVFLSDVELADLEAELDVREGVALGGDTVAQDASTGVSAAQALIQHSLNKKIVVIVVEIERGIACHIQLRG